jgi:hypothetical protein
MVQVPFVVLHGPVQQGEGIGFVIVGGGVAEGLHGLDHGFFGGIAFAAQLTGADDKKLKKVSELTQNLASGERSEAIQEGHPKKMDCHASYGGSQ